MTWRARLLADDGDSLFAEVAKSHAKRNCLVIGPAGSGKLSLVRGLAVLTNSRSRKFLFDWEVEREAQLRLLEDLASRINIGVDVTEVWIHRKIHLVKDNERRSLFTALLTLTDSACASVICYATSEPQSLEKKLTMELERIFTVRIDLGNGGFVHGAMADILSRAMWTLGNKYGRRVNSIEPEAIQYLENLATDAQLQLALSALERAFVLEDGPHLHLSTLTRVHAMPTVSSTQTETHSHV